MANPIDLDAAKRVYEATRHVAFSDQPRMDPTERLSLLTVAADLRPAALFVSLEPGSLTTLKDLLINLGIATLVVQGIPEGPDQPGNHEPAVVEAFIDEMARSRDSETSLSLWVFRDREQRNAVKRHRPDSPGKVLGYPECCVSLRKEEQHKQSQAYLDGLVRAFGNRPAAIVKAIRDDVQVESDTPWMAESNKRMAQSLHRYPFIVHDACGTCLQSDQSPSARLNETYKSLAQEVDQELCDRLLAAGAEAAQILTSLE